MEASLQEILDARERRVQTQQALLSKYRKPLLCFTMNIPGPVKMDRDVSIGFFVGNRLLCDALSGAKVLHREQQRPITGCEAYYVVDLPARELKELAVSLEDLDPIGRLFDMDVLDTNGQKISRESLGYPRRKCLLCHQDAVICGRSRTHSLDALRDRTGFLLYLAARNDLAEYIAAKAWGALMLEVSTTPKPGLVDRRNNGAHADMDRRHFFASANALRSYFCRMAEEGYLSRDLSPQETFTRIRPIGVEAEQAMLQATQGVNTHKGAIFSLGLLCAAAGRLDPAQWSIPLLLDTCAAMAAGLLESDFSGLTLKNAKTVGERLYVQYGITGIRGQAAAGFPAVQNVGLPVLREGLRKGLSMNDAGCAALLHLIAATDDTNLIRRSNRETQLSIRAQVAALVKETPFPPPPVIEALDDEFIRKNLSPGGCADLLAMCYFLLSLQP